MHTASSGCVRNAASACLPHTHAQTALPFPVRVDGPRCVAAPTRVATALCPYPRVPARPVHTPPPGGVQGANSASIRFLLDGDPINVTDTPDTLEMEDGDVIDVHQQQTGGSW